MKKAINIETKTSFQPHSGIKIINSKYLKSCKPIKKNEDKANQEHQNRNKAKSH